jgi:hypothetical protein
MHPREQTIFALSSGRPPSAISVVRVSGPQAGVALTSLAERIPKPRMAMRALLRDANRQPIDDAVALCSRTRECDRRGCRRIPSMAGARCSRLFAALSVASNVRRR